MGSICRTIVRNIAFKTLILYLGVFPFPANKSAQSIVMCLTAHTLYYSTYKHMYYDPECLHNLYICSCARGRFPSPKAFGRFLDNTSNIIKTKTKYKGAGGNLLSLERRHFITLLKVIQFCKSTVMNEGKLKTKCPVGKVGNLMDKGKATRFDTSC